MAHRAVVRHRIIVAGTCRASSVAHRAGCACGAPGWVRHRNMIFLWRMYPCATEKNFVATILWRTQQTWGCATESENGAPLILLSMVVFEALDLAQILLVFTIWTGVPIVVVMDNMSIRFVPRMIPTESTIVVVAMGSMAASSMGIISTMVIIFLCDDCCRRDDGDCHGRNAS